MGTKMNLSDRIKENIENMGAAGESIASCLDIKSKVDCLPLPNRMKEFILELNEGQQMILCDKSLCTQFIYAVFTFIFFFYI